MPPTAVVTGGAGGIGSAVCRRLDSVTRSLGRRVRADERARDDLGPDGITVHAVSPGLTRTPGGEADLAAGIPEEALEVTAAQRSRASARGRISSGSYRFSPERRGALPSHVRSSFSLPASVQ